MYNIKSHIDPKRVRYILISIIFALLIISQIAGHIPPLQFSDGVPMLNRIQHFKNGELTLGEYLFTAHGNSIHPLVYIVGLLDSILFSNLSVLQTWSLYVGMLGTAIIISWIIYDDKASFLTNLLVSFISVVIIVGSYNFDLYLPFQMVLTFSRLLFVINFCGILYCLHAKDTKLLLMWLVFSSLCALSHGVGLMFAGTIFYLHIAHRQTLKKIIMSLMPAAVYVLFQLGYNEGWGEISTNTSPYMIKYFFVFLQELWAYYGGLLNVLFHVPQNLALIAGCILWIIISFILLGYFLRGLNIEKYIEKRFPIYKNISERFLQLDGEGFWLAMLGISFLAAVGASAFTVARIDLVSAFAINPIGYIMQTGRYMCFSVMPYIYILKKLQELLCQKAHPLVYNLIFTLFLVIICRSNYIQTQVTIQRNEDIDHSATALLSGIDSKLPIAEGIFSGFQNNWYWKDEIPALIENYKINYDCIWKDTPEIGAILNEESPLLTIESFSLEPYQEDDKYNHFTATSISAPKRRYSALVDSKNKVVGYIYKTKRPGIYKEDAQNWYFFDKYEWKGFILNEVSQNDTLFLYDGSYCTKNKKNRGRKYIKSGVFVVENLTNADGWESGIFIPTSCFLIKKTPETLAILENASIIKNEQKGCSLPVREISIEEDWIKIFVSSDKNIDYFKYPNVLSVYIER